MEWISVEDRLPETNKLIVFYYNNQFHIGYFIGKTTDHNELLMQSHIDGYNCVQVVNYWAELPEPPKE